MIVCVVHTCTEMHYYGIYLCAVEKVLYLPSHLKKSQKGD